MISKKYRKRFENVQKRWGVIYRAVIQKAQKYAGPVLSRFNQFWHRVSPKLTVKWVVLFGIVLMALITFFFDSMIYEPSRNQIIALNKQITSLNAQKLTINKELIDQSKLFTKVVLKAKDVNKSKELFKSLSRTDVINLCMEKLNDYNMELVYLKTNMMQNYGGTQLKKMNPTSNMNPTSKTNPTSNMIPTDEHVCTQPSKTTPTSKRNPTEEHVWIQLEK